ncbi:hypothetical protein ABZ791_00080 [Streptomyces huasconensis]|uniref:Uncharacterized protein n=1 Tax=Streptomyces huasconensis TaxID=1854574 RepID=A0ABV3LSN6_9ACTN
MIIVVEEPHGGDVRVEDPEVFVRQVVAEGVGFAAGCGRASLPRAAFFSKSA